MVKNRNIILIKGPFKGYFGEIRAKRGPNYEVLLRANYNTIFTTRDNFEYVTAEGNVIGRRASRALSGSRSPRMTPRESPKFLASSGSSRRSSGKSSASARSSGRSSIRSVQRDSGSPKAGLVSPRFRLSSRKLTVIYRLVNDITDNLGIVQDTEVTRAYAEDIEKLVASRVFSDVTISTDTYKKIIIAYIFFILNKTGRNVQALPMRLAGRNDDPSYILSVVNELGISSMGLAEFENYISRVLEFFKSSIIPSQNGSRRSPGTFRRKTAALSNREKDAIDYKTGSNWLSKFPASVKNNLATILAENVRNIEASTSEVEILQDLAALLLDSGNLDSQANLINNKSALKYQLLKKYYDFLTKNSELKEGHKKKYDKDILAYVKDNVALRLQEGLSDPSRTDIEKTIYSRILPMLDTVASYSPSDVARLRLEAGVSTGLRKLMLEEVLIICKIMKSNLEKFQKTRQIVRGNTGRVTKKKSRK